MENDNNKKVLQKIIEFCKLSTAILTPISIILNIILSIIAVLD